MEGLGHFVKEKQRRQIPRAGWLARLCEGQFRLYYLVFGEFPSQLRTQLLSVTDQAVDHNLLSEILSLDNGRNALMPGLHLKLERSSWNECATGDSECWRFVRCCFNFCSTLVGSVAAIACLTDPPYMYVVSGLRFRRL